MSKNLDKCRSGRDFVNYVENHPAAHDIRQSGSHFMAKGPRPGLVVIPVHNGDLPPGTRRSILRMLALIGLAAVPLACLVIRLLSIGG
jgi:predicted RNA binding protein YcfA (HicA-like mRNA interferase family)